MSCRSCWAKTGARICETCKAKVKELCDRANHARNELATEKDKTAVKGRQGGGGMKDNPPASLAAIEADTALTQAVKLLQAEGKIRQDGDPAAIIDHLYMLQKPTKATAEEDKIGMTILNFEGAIIACERLIDVPEDRRMIGRCNCGSLVRQHPGQSTVRCRTCGRTRMVAETTARLQEELSEYGQDSWLKDPEMCLFMAWEYGHDLKPATLRKWVSRGKISRDTRGRTHVPDVLDMLESSVLKVA